MLCCQTRLWDSYVWMCTSVNMWVCLRDEVSCQESTTVSLPSCLKHAKPPHLLSAYCWLELHVYVCFCCLLGAATLPRLLMLYLLLIRMSRLSLAICTSWLDNPLPSVWCHWGSWRGVLPPNYKAKRPFCFVVVVFFSHFLKNLRKFSMFSSGRLTGGQGGFGWHESQVLHWGLHRLDSLRRTCLGRCFNRGWERWGGVKQRGGETRQNVQNVSLSVGFSGFYKINTTKIIKCFSNSMFLYLGYFACFTSLN